MEDTPRHASIQDRLRVLRRHRVLIVAVMLAAVGVSLFLSLRQDERYAAEANLVFRDISADVSLVGGFAQAEGAPASLASAAASTIERPEVIEAAKAELGTPKTPDELRDDLTAVADPRSNLVTVTAEADEPRFAAALANAVAIAARDQENIQTRRRFEIAARSLRIKQDSLEEDQSEPAAAVLAQQLTQVQALARFARPADVASPARVPDDPVSPKPLRDGVIAGVLGLLLGVGAAFLMNSLDRRLRTSHDIQSHLDIPLVGHVRKEMMGKTTQELDEDAVTSVADLEAFQILRANLGFLDVDSPQRTVAVTSALPQEGKSTVAASLALAGAASGKRTLLIECDLRRPVLARRLGLQVAPGIVDYLVGAAEPGEILQTVPVHPLMGSSNGDAPDGDDDPTHSLVCITAGTLNPRAGELIASERFRMLLSEVSEAYDLVVIDTAPLLSVADTLDLVPHVDRVLLCVCASMTTRDQALAGKAALGHVAASSIGLVVTGESASEESEYGYYHPYRYSYSPSS